MTAAQAAPPLARDLTREQKRAILKSVPCDYCGAQPGGPCSRLGGGSGGGIHQSRYAEVSRRKLVTW